MKKILFCSGIILLTCFATAQKQTTDKLKMKIDEAARKIEPKCIAWRRDFHQFPELSNREFRTAKIVAEHLKKLGIETKEGVAKTGVVGILRGTKPGPCVALRADMDALPITERTPVPFASRQTAEYNGQTVGVMHACGHDAHTAILMAVAEILAGMKNELRGTVKFIFQPAEEGAPEGEEGGAPLMIKEGVMDNPKVDVIFGLHIGAERPAGLIEYKKGAAMASSDVFKIVIKGKGGHGSQPWKAVDPVAIAAQVIQGLQHIVSRQTELTKAPAVISVTMVDAGVRQNIIPEECVLQGTIRTLDSKMQEQIHEKIKHTAEKIAEAGGASATVNIVTRTLVTYNTPELVEQMLPALRKAVGDDLVKEGNWVTGAEDFSYYGTKAPAFFFYLGGMKPGDDPQKAAPHHTADFYIDESGFINGIKAFCHLVFDYMNKSQAR